MTEKGVTAQKILIQDVVARSRILKALADKYSQAILLSTVEKAVSVVDLSREHDIPISTTYRRVHELEESGLIVVQRIVITDDGKKYDLYRASVKGVKVILGLGLVCVELEPNDDTVAKFMRVWCLKLDHSNSPSNKRAPVMPLT